MFVRTIGYIKKDTFLVIDNISDEDGLTIPDRENFMITSVIKRVVKYNTLKSVECDIDIVSFNDFLMRIWNCPKESLFPFYVGIVKVGTKYIIHPGDRDKMAKLLDPPQTGVDALVQELRFNVDIVHEVDEAKNDFNKRTRS